MFLAGVLIRAAAGSRPRTYSVRIQPLGSPTGLLERSYVHVPGVLYTVFVPGTGMSAGEWCTRGGAGGWVPGGYTGVGTAQRGRLVLPGPNQCQIPLSARPPRHSRSLQGPPHTWAPHALNLAPGTK